MAVGKQKFMRSITVDNKAIKENFMTSSTKTKKALFLFLSSLVLMVAVNPAIAADKSGITINFQDVDISTVINSVSRITGRTFIVDPRVKGKVTVVASEAVPEKKLYAIFLSILQVHDLTAIETNGVTKIIPTAMAKHEPTEVVEKNVSSSEVKKDKSDSLFFRSIPTGMPVSPAKISLIIIIIIIQ